MRDTRTKGARLEWLMLLPAMALGGWAWSQSRPSGSSGPPRVVVPSVEHEALTPRDVAQGFDTRVKITLGHEGARPRGWGEKNETQYLLTGPSTPDVELGTESSRQREGGVRSNDHGYDAAVDGYSATYLLRLRDVPRGKPVRLASHFLSQERKPNAIELRDVLELSWKAVVRRAGEKTPAPPKVSRFCPLTLRRVEFFDRRKPGSSYDFNVEVICEIAPALVDNGTGAGKLSVEMADAYLEDNRGRRWKNMALSSAAKPSSGPDILRFYDWHSTQPLPKKLDGFTFRALISVGDHWPLEVRVPVRDIQ